MFHRKLDNLHEMDKILGKQTTKTTEEKIKIVNRLIAHKEIELVIKNFPQKTKPAPDGFTGEIIPPKA